MHEALRVTPAMQLGVTDGVWTIAELVDAALIDHAPDQQQGQKVGKFTIIDGG
jgi:hypothetical protein